MRGKSMRQQITVSLDSGDADRVAPEFFGAGGELIFVNMQDIYED